MENATKDTAQDSNHMEIQKAPELHLLVNDPEKGSMGDQLARLKEAGAIKTVPEGEQRINPHRGGRKTKAKPGVLGPAVKKTQEERDEEKRLLNQARERLEKDELRFKKEAREMLDARSVFVEDIKLLKKSLVGATGTQEKRLKALLSQAEDHVRVIDEVSPRVEPSAERGAFVFRSIVEKFKQYEKARRAQAHAEIKVNEGVEKYKGEYTRAQAEAASLHGEITSLIKEGEIVIARDKPNPITDDSVHMDTGKEDEARARERKTKEEEQIDEQEVKGVIFGGPATEEEKKMQEDMDELNKDKKMKFEQPTKEQDVAEKDLLATAYVGSYAEKTVLPKGNEDVLPVRNEGEHALRVDARIKEVEARQAELEAVPASPFLSKDHGMELDELKKEAESLAEEKKKSPLPVLNEVAEVVVPPSQPTTTAAEATPEEIHGTPRNPEEAVLAFEKHLTAQEKVKPVLSQEEIMAIAEKNKIVRERALGNIAALDAQVEAVAEGKNLLKYVRSAAESWKKIPLPYRVLLTSGIAVSGAGAMAAGALATGSTLLAAGAGFRALSGAVLFTGMEELMRRQHERKTGKPITASAAARQTFLAGALAIVVAGLLPTAMHNAFDLAAPEVAALSQAEIAKAAEIAKLKAEITAEASQGQANLAALENLTENTAPSSGEPSEWMKSLDARMAENLTPERAQAIGGEISKALAENDVEKIAALEEEMGITHNEFLKLLGESRSVEGLPHAELSESMRHTLATMGSPVETIAPTIIPGDAALLAATEARASEVLAGDMDKLFGGPKFAWFGHVNGLDSINWKDPEVGFGGKTVSEILSAKPASIPMDGGKTFGIENYEATQKMQRYITNITNISGTTPNANEKVADFIRRAALAKLSK